MWIWSLAFAFILLYVNARSVSNFGTFEYWFAMIKVTAIVLFIILGAVHIFGIGVPAVGFHNLTGLPGGFMPHGLAGVWMAVIMGVFSFNGIEVIAVTSGEAQDPVKAIPAALRTMLLRLFLFYILALTIVVAFVPWTETGAKVVEQSPFVKVFAQSGVAYAAGIMNFVVHERRALEHEHERVPVLADAVLALARQLRAAVPGQTRPGRTRRSARSSSRAPAF